MRRLRPETAKCAADEVAYKYLLIVRRTGLAYSQISRSDRARLTAESTELQTFVQVAANFGLFQPPFM